MNESDREVATLSAVAGEKGWLNRNVVGMGITSLLSDWGHEMATAVLPAFLAVIGAPAAALGVIEGVADAVSSFVKLGAGWYTDRIGRRKAICVGGYFLTGVSKAVFAFAAGWPLVLLGRVLGWFGRGIRGPLRDAILAKRYRTPLGSQLADFLGTASGFLGSGVSDRERVKPDPSGDDRLCLVLRVAMPQRRACGFSDGVLTNNRTRSLGI